MPVTKARRPAAGTTSWSSFRRSSAGKPIQLRHRMVYDALGPMMKKEIHALAIKAYAPGEI